MKLTPEQIEENLACYRQAMENGNDASIENVSEGGGWERKSHSGFWIREIYRRKPKPTLRPWKPEEVPVGALVRLEAHPNAKMLITEVRTYPSRFTMVFGSLEWSPENLPGWEHSLDHGKTWLPCGVVE